MPIRIPLINRVVSFHSPGGLKDLVHKDDAQVPDAQRFRRAPDAGSRIMRWSRIRADTQYLSVDHVNAAVAKLPPAVHLPSAVRQVGDLVRADLARIAATGRALVVVGGDEHGSATALACHIGALGALPADRPRTVLVEAPTEFIDKERATLESVAEHLRAGNRRVTRGFVLALAPEPPQPGGHARRRGRRDGLRHARAWP